MQHKNVPHVVVAPEMFLAEEGIARVSRHYLQAIAQSRPHSPLRVVVLNDNEVSAKRLRQHGATRAKAVACSRNKARFLKAIWNATQTTRCARDLHPRSSRPGTLVTAATGASFHLRASPLILIAAIAIKLTDGGVVFFRQTRIGLNRQPFQMAKLRTIRENSNPGEDDQRYTQKSDPRITKIGALLRKTRLDEFPQLWNVIRGEMSLIGPRAEWDELVKDYQEQISCYHFRHLVRPGVTGWAQINYPYGANIEDTLRKLEYDLNYIRHFSFVMDAAIVLRTVHLMLFGKGR